MKMTMMQAIITVAVVVLATVLTRFLPYLIFPEGKPIPKTIQYLGQVLGPAVFSLLVIYCLRHVEAALMVCRKSLAWSSRRLFIS